MKQKPTLGTKAAQITCRKKLEEAQPIHLFIPFIRQKNVWGFWSDIANFTKDSLSASLHFVHHGRNFVWLYFTAKVENATVYSMQRIPSSLNFYCSYTKYMWTLN